MTYNIIYTSNKNETFLWNGHSLDQLRQASLDELLFSGRVIGHEQLAEEFRKCKALVHQLYPLDTDPDIKPVQVKVSK